jgi:hypothetical protein
MGFQFHRTIKIMSGFSGTYVSPIKQEIKNKTACGVNIMSDGSWQYNQILAE